MKNYTLFIFIAVLSFSACNTKGEKGKEYTTDTEPVYVEKNEENSNAEKILSTAEAIAKANGLKKWDHVKEIKFTFNVDKDSSHFERSWSWMPKYNKVTYFSKEDTLAYYRAKLDSTTIKLDTGFINDKYWLLCPFNLVWDADSFVSKHYFKVLSPIQNVEMQKLTIVYNDSDGYTPGDAYDFYFKGDFIIREWVYRKGNQEKPSLITSWEDYQDFNGIRIAKVHQRDEGDWKLYFTNIEVITE
ncbi:hypothetical protein [Aquimarina pacifica]|uniref:hypothetical protein n=1 Tax=Aquimarina pacifica TaxID=1296415 RepID=UPI000471DECF|nr:hypothetical protein [Aquimarina pacifica]